MPDPAVNSYEFRGFRVDIRHRILLAPGGEAVQLTPKVFDLLVYLVRNRGKTLPKDEIMSSVWPDTVVEESNLTQNISILRRALGDARGENSYIVTIPGQGYRFVPETSELPEKGNVDIDEQPVREDTHSFPATWLTGVAAILVIAALAAAYYFSARSGKTPAIQPRTLAILPFKPLVAESSDDALQMGMADTLIARLSNASGLVLKPLSSVRRFTALDQDPQSAGRELGADAVLDGSIQRWGERIRVNVRLIDVATGESIWGSSFDDEYTDIFVVQDAISARLADALRLKLAATGGSQRPPANVEAYRLYLQARLFQFRSTPPDVKRAIEFYRQATDTDPGYALAYAGMADAYRMLPITSDVSPNEAFPHAKAAALKAIELDDGLAEAHLALGYVASWYEWDWRTAESEIRRAVDFAPNSVDAHRGLSVMLTALGRHDEAIREMQLARELDPMSVVTGALEAQALHYAGRDAEAESRLGKVFEIDPGFWIGRLMLARIFINQSKWNEALIELDRARANSGGNSETISLAAYALARSGRQDKALKTIDQLKAMATEEYSPSYNIAMAYNGLNDTENALRWLEDAAARRDVRLILLKVETKWDNLRSEQRFQDVVKRIGME